MIRRSSEQLRKELSEFQGGTGTLHARVLVTPEELLGRGRVFNRMEVPPGSSIGLHAHTGDFEIIYILSGRGTAVDDGAEAVLEAGDILYTGDGHTHALRCEGPEPLEILAVVLYT